MNELCRFSAPDALRLSPEALSLDDPATWLRANHNVPATQIEPVRSLKAVIGLIDDVTSRFDRFDTSADAYLVVPLRKALALTRREASDRKLWGWLGAYRFPEYVAYRWAPSPKTGLRSSERFTGDIVRQTFARLWWAAELTRVGVADYSLTEQLFLLSGVQDTYEAIFGRAFCGYLPAVRAFIDEVGRARPQVVRETAKEFSNLLTTVVLESVAEEDLRKLLASLRSEVEKKLE